MDKPSSLFVRSKGEGKKKLNALECYNKLGTCAIIENAYQKVLHSECRLLPVLPLPPNIKLS